MVFVRDPVEIEAIRAAEDVSKLKSPLDGNDLMALFGRGPGPWIAPLAQVSAAVPATMAATIATTVTPARGRRRPWRPLLPLVTELSPPIETAVGQRESGLNGQKKAMTRYPQ